MMFIAIVSSMTIAGCTQQKIKYHLSPFQDDGSKLYGLVNDEGRIVVPATYALTTPSQDGLALAITKENYRVYIDGTGKVVSRRTYYNGGRFYNNRADVFDSEWGNCIIDKDEKLICKLGEGHVYGFKNGLCMIECGDKIKIINQEGKVVFPLQTIDMEKISIIGGGFFVVYNDNGSSIVYDKTGEKLFESPHVITEYFDGVFCTGNPMRTGNGIIDITGNPITSMDYNIIIPIGGGLANANRNGEWCFIDNKGEVIQKHNYGWDVNEFSNGRAAVKLDGKYGFINNEGTLVIPCKYDDIEIPGWNGVLGFNGTFAKVMDNGHSYYIDKEGSIAIFE